jgi:hypothetical protein
MEAMIDEINTAMLAQILVQKKQSIDTCLNRKIRNLPGNTLQVINQAAHIVKT